MLFYNIFALCMRSNQGLDTDFTAKGKKESRKQGKFYVRISYGKHVVKCKPYTGCLNAEQYCKIITQGLMTACRVVVVHGQNIFYQITVQ